MAKLSKPELLEKLGAHVLDHGLSGASLRPMAKAAGTSDRMLIYHFGNKEQLVAEVLQALAVKFAEQLEAALPRAPLPDAGNLLHAIIPLLRSEPLGAYIRVWQDILAAATRGDAAFVQTASEVAEFFVQWIEARLPADQPDQTTMAQYMLVLIEGDHAMCAAGRSDIADAALVKAFPR